MGLLDYFQSDPAKQEALRAGLLNAGIAMLSNNNPGLWQAVGGGLGAGVGAYKNKYEEDARRKALKDAVAAGTRGPYSQQENPMRPQQGNQMQPRQGNQPQPLQGNAPASMVPGRAYSIPYGADSAGTQEAPQPQLHQPQLQPLPSMIPGRSYSMPYVSDQDAGQAVAPDVGDAGGLWPIAPESQAQAQPAATLAPGVDPNDGINSAGWSWQKKLPEEPAPQGVGQPYTGQQPTGQQAAGLQAPGLLLGEPPQAAPAMTEPSYAALPARRSLPASKTQHASGGFDRNAVAIKLMESGDPALWGAALQLLPAEKAAIKPHLVEVFDDKTGRMEKQWVTPGQSGGVHVGYGKPEAELDPFGKDLREALAVNYGVRDPRMATPEQLKAAYASLNADKDRRSPKTTVSVGGSTVLGPDYGKKADTLGAEYLWSQFAETRNAATAVSATKDALKLLDEGMFTGRLGPAQQSVAAWYQAATGNNMAKLDATQQFKLVIGDIVLPALANLKGASSDRDFIKIEEYSRGEATITESALKGHLNRLLNKYGAQVKSFNSTLDDYTAAGGKALPGLRKFDNIQGYLGPKTPKTAGTPTAGHPTAVLEVPQRAARKPASTLKEGLPPPPLGISIEAWNESTAEDRKLWMK